MTLTLKRKAVKDQPPKKPLMPLAMQAARFGAAEVSSGEPSSQMREMMRKGLLRKAAEMVYAKFSLDVEDLARDPRTDASVALTAGLCWAGAVLEDRESGFRFVGTAVGFEASNPAGSSLGTIRYEELLPVFRSIAFTSPDKTGTTTPAGIRANDPDAAPAKATLSPESAAVPFAAIVPEKYSLRTFQRHPDNRHPAESEVAALAADLQAHQQREPVLARRLPKGSLQILWGEKRWLAAKEAGLPELWARVTECDDTRALELVAQGNAQRSDFNPIEKARLIEKLGQAGKTRAQAAAAVGLESDSAASNLVRLLRLPQAWQDRVAAGELAESWARLLTPYVHIPAMMKDFEKEWQDRLKGYHSAFIARDELEDEIPRLTSGCLRIPAEEHWFRGDYQQGIPAGDYKCLFEITPEVRKKLGFTTLDVSEGGKQKTVEAATNVKLYDQLQEAAIRETHKAKAKKKAKSAGAKADAEREKPKTKAEIERAKKIRAEQLTRGIDDWKERIVRRELAAAIRKAKPGDLKVQKLAVACLFGPPPEPHYNEPGFRDMLEGLLGVGKTNQDEYQIISNSKAGSGELFGLAAEFVAAAIAGTADRPSHYLWQETLDQLFVEWGCDMPAAWRALYTTKAPELEEFFQMHRKGELQVLGKELGVHLADNLGKPQMLKLLLERRSPLPLPKCLQPAPPKRKKGAK